VSILLFSGSGVTGRPLQSLDGEVGRDGSFSATAEGLQPGLYTAVPQWRGARGDARTFLDWPLGAARDNSSVAFGKVEGPVLAISRLGRAVSTASFDGVSDRIVVLGSKALDAIAGVTLQGWIKRKKSQDWQNVIAKPGTGAAADQNYALWINPENRIVALFGGNGRSYARVDGPSPLEGQWHQVVATYDGRSARLYLDGALVATRRSSVRLVPNSFPLMIGSGGDGFRAFGGELAEVAIFPEALSMSLIRRRYAATAEAFDQSAPAISISTPAAGTFTADRTPALAGMAGVAAGDSSKVTVNLFEGTEAIGKPLQKLTTTRFKSGAWGVSTPSPLVHGTYTAKAEQSDGFGNVGRTRGTSFTVRPPRPSADPVLVGAGDIADCADTGDEATAKLLLDHPSAVVQTFGDNAYSHGSASDFGHCYDPSWGLVKSRTRPAIGDHEYETPEASGYFDYFSRQLAPFGTSARDPRRAYYSYNLGAWHIVVLNAACRDAPGCGVDAQVEWLDSDLGAHRNRCTLAVLHKNRWSSGSVHGDNATMQPYWDALYANAVDLVLGGDEHVYERYAPQDPQGLYDPLHGLREFIVGTGGGSLYRFANVNANSEVRYRASFGILKLTLHPTSYEWQFIPTAGSFSDSGSSSCH
jgi:hypothetical protein